MTTQYYRDDFERGAEYRLNYFDNQFKLLVSSAASNLGLTVTAFLSGMTNFEEFKSILKDVFSLDPSLANYVEGMTNRDFKLFYSRNEIQNIVQANRAGEAERIEILIPTPGPAFIRQIDKQTRILFRATFIEISTGKQRRTVGRKDTFKIRGKEIIVHRDAKGRFVKISR